MEKRCFNLMETEKKNGMAPTSVAEVEYKIRLLKDRLFQKKILQEVRDIVGDQFLKFEDDLVQQCRWRIFLEGKKFASRKQRNSIIKELHSWTAIHSSPYSLSFYDTAKKTWYSTPEGSLRLSDHWNFKSKGEKHCELDYTSEYVQKWLLCRFENGKYRVIKEF